MVSARPLDAYPLMRTSSIEEMEDALGRIYAKPSMQIVGMQRTLEAIHNHCQLEQLGLTYGSYGINARWKFPETDYVAYVIPVRGAVEFKVAGVSAAIDPNCGLIVPSNVSFNMANNAAYERLNLVIHPTVLTAKLNAILGRSTDTQLRMDSVQSPSGWTAKYMREHVKLLADQLSAPTPVPSLLLAEFEQSLLAALLHIARHNYSHLLEQAPSDIDIQQMRRAEECIEENWAEPMSMETLAATINVGIGHLDRKFKQVRGYSLRTFRKYVRLRHARRMLQKTDRAITVQDVALASGFADVYGFNSDYFRQFGEHPADTLARSTSTRTTRH